LLADTLDVIFLFCSKSTILRLLFRFYEPTRGQIFVDGQDITTVTLESLRRQIGVVPQETMLFNDTIFYNIEYGRPGSDRDAVIVAAKKAQIHDMVQELPEQYDTRVGERGAKLSGGEKQRLAIARCILKAPRLLLYDEATSALDSKTEQAVLQALGQLARGRTCIQIAHRLLSLQDADTVFVLKDGRIVEHGSPLQLLTKPDGEYQKFYHMQQSSSSSAHKK